MKKITILFLLIFSITNTYSQDILGAQIIGEKLPTALTCRFSIELYTTVENNVDRPTVSIDLGDGQHGILNLLSKDTVDSNLIVSKYDSIEHSYGSQGSYFIEYIDSFWVNDIVNWEGSENHYFGTQLDIEVPTHPFYTNKFPRLKYPFNDITVSDSGRVTITNTAIDPDGDDLYYFLETAVFHSDYNVSMASDTVYMDFLNGDIVWDKPLQAGRNLLFLRFRDVRGGTFILDEQLIPIVVELDSLWVTSLNNTIKNKGNFSIFPNPVDDFFNIKQIKTSSK
jgi:hypothetical protein